VSPCVSMCPHTTVLHVCPHTIYRIDRERYLSTLADGLLLDEAADEEYLGLDT
jgi:hypothetical protein